MSSCLSFYKGVFVAFIGIDLMCGLVASIGVAFAESAAPTSRVLLCLIICLIDLVFVFWLLYYIFKEICRNNIGAATMNGICGVVTVVTAALFGLLWFLTSRPHTIVGVAFVVYVVSLFPLYSAAWCYSHRCCLPTRDDEDV